MFLTGYREIFTRMYLRGYFRRNKYYMLLSVLILAASLIVGFVFADLFKDMVMEAMKNIAQNISDDNLVMAYDILFNNLKVAFLIILFGILFSIISALVLFVNGMIIGFLFKIMPAGVVLIYIVPHGIFELPAIMLSVVCAFLVTRLVINLIKGTLQNGKTFVGEFNNSKIIIKDIVLSIVIIVVLLVVAAFVESFITPVIGNYLVSSFNLIK